MRTGSEESSKETVVVQIEYRQHRSDRPPAVAAVACIQKVLASYSMLQPWNPQDLADRFG